jgi:hypothetical protein
LRLGRAPVSLNERGPLEEALAGEMPSPDPETDPKSADEALATAPAPADRAAPPAATSPPALAVAAAPTAAPALKRKEDLNKIIMLKIVETEL